MRSIRGSLVNLQPLIDVSIGAYGCHPDERRAVKALVDTGATRTCITASMIQALGLQPRGKLIVASATSHAERRRAYGYSLGLFCFDERSRHDTLYVVEHEFVAPPFQDNDNFSVLLGMDILSQGRLVFERDGSFAFDFEF